MTNLKVLSRTDPGANVPGFLACVRNSASGRVAAPRLCDLVASLPRADAHGSNKYRPLGSDACTTNPRTCPRFTHKGWYSCIASLAHSLLVAPAASRQPRGERDHGSIGPQKASPGQARG